MNSFTLQGALQFMVGTYSEVIDMANTATDNYLIMPLLQKPLGAIHDSLTKSLRTEHCIF